MQEVSCYEQNCSKNKTITVNSISAAVMISSGIIYLFCSNIFRLPRAGMVAPIICLVMWISNFSFNGKIRVHNIELILIVLLDFIFTVVFGVSSLSKSELFVTIVAWVIIPCMIVRNEIDAKILLKSLLIISLLIIPVFGDVFSTKIIEEYGSIDLGISYVINIPIVAAIIYSAYYKSIREQSVFEKILLVYCCVLFVANFLFGLRGAILQIVVTVLTVLVFPKKAVNDNPVIDDVSYKKRRFLVLFVILIIIITAMYFETIILWIADIISNLSGTTPSFIKKIINTMQIGNLSSNRNLVYDITLRGIMEKPITGWGIKSFSIYSSGRYPYQHNFLLQLVFDSGLLLSLIILIPFLICICNMWTVKIKEYNEMVLFVTFFSITFIKVLFSGDIWEQPAFWMMLQFSWMITHKKITIRRTR